MVNYKCMGTVKWKEMIIKKGDKMLPTDLQNGKN